jgi:hypothetical protein
MGHDLDTNQKPRYLSCWRPVEEAAVYATMLHRTT